MQPLRALTLRHAWVCLIVLGPLKGDVLKGILKAKAGRQPSIRKLVIKRKSLLLQTGINPELKTGLLSLA